MIVWALLGWFALAAFGVVSAAILAGLETGVYTLNRVVLAVRVGRGDRRAIVLDSELARPDRVLTTLLVGVNVAHYLGGLGIAAALELFEVGTVMSVVINTAVLLPITFVGGEILPKDLFRTYTDRWTYHFGAPLRILRLLCTVTLLVPIVEWIAGMVRRWVGADERAALLEPRQRISKLIREGVHAGVLSESQTTLADRALTLRGRTVASEMTPWNQVASVAIAGGREDRAAILRRSGASRLPVLDQEGRVVGILTTLDAILNPGVPTAALMAKPTTFAPTEPALRALRTMRSTRTRLAIVADPATGHPLGVVAIKDLVEPITGQLIGS